MLKISQTKPYLCGSSIFLPLLLLVVTIAPVSATESFYQESKHGWFWYEDPPPDIKKEIDPKHHRKPQPRLQPSLSAYSIDELWSMHPDDFQELLGKLQKKAVQTPIEQNILEYLTMQDIARRKALAYTNATMYVTQKHGEMFNVGHVYPAAGPGVTARVRMQQNEVSAAITQAKDDHALLFFSKSGCGFCKEQSDILEYFIDRYGWQIRKIDIGKFPQNASRFGISVTPTLLLIKKGESKHLPVSTGVIALSELERKLYRTIRFLAGNTSADTYLLYEFQRDSTLDPTSILHKGKQPWKSAD